MRVRSWTGTGARVGRHVYVSGSGQLSRATRVELARLGIHRDSDHQLPALQPPLVIACGDSEIDDSFGEAANRALREGSPLLLACLLDRVIRIGPIIEPAAIAASLRMPARRATAVAEKRASAAPHVAMNPRTALCVRLGALIIGAQALSFLLGDRARCVLGRVVELDPWSIESKGYRVIKVRH